MPKYEQARVGFNAGIVTLRERQLGEAMLNLHDPNKAAERVARSRALLPDTISDEEVEAAALSYLREQVRFSALVLDRARGLALEGHVPDTTKSA